MTFSTREQSEKQREAIIQLMLLSLIPAEKSDPREREKYQLFEVTRIKIFLDEFPAILRLHFHAS